MPDNPQAPLPWQAHTSLLASIRVEWDLAEADIKQAEQVCHKVVVPAIKELRYAGRRIVEALREFESPDGGRASAFLQDAQFNCHRARHDAIDAGTAKIAADIDIMVTKLGHDVILFCYPDFAGLFHDLNSIREVIVASRADRSKRAEFYLKLETSEFPALVKRHLTMMAAEPIMRGKAKRARWERAISYGIGGAGLILTVWSAGFAYYVWYHP